MTNEEARRILMSDADFSGIGEKAKVTADALCVAIDALQKQIPMKPNNCKTSGGQKGHMCPRCHRILVLGYPQYCEFCGQRIDFE